MLKRRDFAAVGMSAAALAAMQASGFAADKDHKHAHGHDGPHMDCAKACSACQRECDACASHCAEHLAKGHKEHLATLQTCRDCADFCSAAAEIVARGGPFAALICEACAEACKRCGKACDKFDDDDMMKACAKECRQCEKACREMLKHVDHS